MYSLITFLSGDGGLQVLAAPAPPDSEHIVVRALYARDSQAVVGLVLVSYAIVRILGRLVDRLSSSPRGRTRR